jgi:hypothetical protein
MGPQCEVVTFLIDSGTSRSSLCLLPGGLIYSLDRILISVVKGESFSVKILQETDLYFQDRTTKVKFLLVPEAGTNLFGRDVMTLLGIGSHVNKGVGLGMLTQKHEGPCQHVAFLSKFLDPVT